MKSVLQSPANNPSSTGPVAGRFLFLFYGLHRRHVCRTAGNDHRTVSNSCCAIGTITNFFIPAFAIFQPLCRFFFFF